MADEGEILSVEAAQLLPGESAVRMAALTGAKIVRPDADVPDQILIAHYILTGSGQFPDVEELQRISIATLESPLDTATMPPAPTEGEGWKGRAP